MANREIRISDENAVFSEHDVQNTPAEELPDEIVRRISRTDDLERGREWLRRWQLREPKILRSHPSVDYPVSEWPGDSQ